MKRKYLFAVNKISYLKNKLFREQNCIFCKISEKSPEVLNLSIYQGKTVTITLNLYPYNPGHLMIFPNRHVEDIRNLKEEEEQEISRLTKVCMNVLDELYAPQGYNIGYNIGKSSGASISHIHLHIVPRFPNELGFIDVIGGAKLCVENPSETLENFRKTILKYINH